ncbi:MAG: ABC transporter ATP-binding protein [Actinobacteria bacterium]|nr:MAG: ABC transporter ATP-binding protein [Actinomycetota bacterium]
MSAASGLLETHDLVVGYVAGVDILHGVDVHVAEGEIVTIAGPNGAGKSTLVRSICGLLPARSGQVLFRGEDISRTKAHAIARKGVGYVPQLNNVFVSMTVEENLELGAIARRRTALRERIAAMYELFPRLKERRRQRAGTLSGGERQMLAMARTLIPEPDVLVLDEPSAGLAPTLVGLIFERIAAINKTGVTILMVEQNARRALAMSHHGYMLDLGRNRFRGTGRELLDNPRVVELYLGIDRRGVRARPIPGEDRAEG